MKKVLITGGAGFIPSSLADALLNTNNYFVVAVDNFLTGKKDHVTSHANYRFIKADINDLNEITPIMLHYGFDVIFHYAAVVGVNRTIDNPKLVLDDLKGIQNIFDLAKNTGVTRIFFSSSSEVYGEPVHLPQNEHVTPLNSRLPYAVVKNIGECFCRSYQKEFGLDYTIFRFFNTYGPRQSDDFVVSKFFKSALSNKDITVYGDGNQTRTFCHVQDNIEFTLMSLQENLFLNDVVNVGNDELTTVMELAEKIITITNSKSKIIKLPPLKEGDMTRRQPDITKMKNALKRPLVALDDGLKSLLKVRWNERE